MMLGADSHTVQAGCLGMIAIGAGGLDVAVLLGGHPYEIACPDIVEVHLAGELARPWVQVKDSILELLRRRSASGGKNKVFEFTGPGTTDLSIPERATIANMIAAEPSRGFRRGGSGCRRRVRRPDRDRPRRPRPAHCQAAQPGQRGAGRRGRGWSLPKLREELESGLDTITDPARRELVVVSRGRRKRLRNPRYLTLSQKDLGCDPVTIDAERVWRERWEPGEAARESAIFWRFLEPALPEPTVARRASPPGCEPATAMHSPTIFVRQPRVNTLVTSMAARLVTRRPPSGPTESDRLVCWWDQRSRVLWQTFQVARSTSRTFGGND
jgi:hypothetical protein